jgi:hypothetical protein
MMANDLPDDIQDEIEYRKWHTSQGDEGLAPSFFAIIGVVLLFGAAVHALVLALNAVGASILTGEPLMRNAAILAGVGGYCLLLAYAIVKNVEYDLKQSALENNGALDEYWPLKDRVGKRLTQIVIATFYLLLVAAFVAFGAALLYG